MPHKTCRATFWQLFWFILTMLIIDFFEKAVKIFFKNFKQVSHKKCPSIQWWPKVYRGSAIFLYIICFIECTVIYRSNSRQLLWIMPQRWWCRKTRGTLYGTPVSSNPQSKNMVDIFAENWQKGYLCTDSWEGLINVHNLHKQRKAFPGK